jgi:hypothetical protein
VHNGAKMLLFGANDLLIDESKFAKNLTIARIKRKNPAIARFLLGTSNGNRTQEKTLRYNAFSVVRCIIWCIKEK